MSTLLEPLKTQLQGSAADEALELIKDNKAWSEKDQASLIKFGAVPDNTLMRYLVQPLLY